MPDIRRKCGKGCLRCWVNRLQHANKHAKAWMIDHPDEQGWWTRREEEPILPRRDRPIKWRGRQAKWDAIDEEVCLQRQVMKTQKRQQNKDRFAEFQKDVSCALQTCTPLGAELSDTVVKFAYT